MSNEKIIEYLLKNGGIQSEKDVLKTEELENPNRIPPLIKILEEEDFLKRNHGFDIVLYTGGFKHLPENLEQAEGEIYSLKLNKNRKYSIIGCSVWYPNPYDGKILINLEGIENKQPLYKTNREFIEKINERLKRIKFKN